MAVNRRKTLDGLSAQLIVMSELAWRGYNVAIPEADFVTDIVSFDEDTGVFRRIQVRESETYYEEQGFSTKPWIPTIKQLTDDSLNDDFCMSFVFVTRRLASNQRGRWDFVILTTAMLKSLVSDQELQFKYTTCPICDQVTQVTSTSSASGDAIYLSGFCNDRGWDFNGWPEKVKRGNIHPNAKPGCQH